MNIHPTAIIENGAKIADNAQVGPYCVIGAKVELEEEAKLISHVTISGNTKIGVGTLIYPFASIGHAPQDLKYHGEESTLTIGRNCRIREYVTVNPGTKTGIMKTQIGDNCLLMIGVHIAHDCIIGNNVIISNNATLAGHVTVGNNAILGGMSAYHQFTRIGHCAIIGGGSMVAEDVIPYGNVKGDRAYLNGLNIIGMKRSNLNRETINALKDAFKRIFLDDDATFEARIQEVHKNFSGHNKVLEITDFLIKHPTKSVCMPKFKMVL